jgi:GT2 family glycosyltransferase
MPVRGVQPDIGDQLEALSRQQYAGRWELLLADNGCHTSTLEVVESWKGVIPKLRIIDARSRLGANFARNKAVDEAAGTLIAICDSDDVVTPGWLDGLSRSARSAEMVGGHLDVTVLNPPLLQAWRPSPTEHGLPLGLDFLPYVAGSNCAIWRDVYQAVGGCDEELVGGGGGDDVDLSWRVQLVGGRVVFAPDAVVHYRLRSDMRSMVRQMTAYGMSAALLYRKFRAYGAQRPRLTVAGKHWIRVVQRGPRELGRPDTRGGWIREVAYLLGRLHGAVRHRVLYW